MLVLYVSWSSINFSACPFTTRYRSSGSRDLRCSVTSARLLNLRLSTVNTINSADSVVGRGSAGKVTLDDVGDVAMLADECKRMEVDKLTGEWMKVDELMRLTREWMKVDKIDDLMRLTD